VVTRTAHVHSPIDDKLSVQASGHQIEATTVSTENPRQAPLDMSPCSSLTSADESDRTQPRDQLAPLKTRADDDGEDEVSERDEQREGDDDKPNDDGNEDTQKLHGDQTKKGHRQRGRRRSKAKPRAVDSSPEDKARGRTKRNTRARRRRQPERSPDLPVTVVTNTDKLSVKEGTSSQTGVQVKLYRALAEHQPLIYEFKSWERTVCFLLDVSK